MSGESLLALDLGTTSARCLVVGADGAVRARAQRPIGARHPHPGWSEFDPLELVARCEEVLAESLAAARLSARDVAGIGIVTQRASVLAWDARTLAPLAPAQSWQDQRTAERVAELRKLGIPINTLASATKLEWWLRHDDAVRAAAREGRLRLGTPDAWLAARLAGRHCTDPGNASCTALFDAGKGEWAQPLLDLFGVPRESLPEVGPTSGEIGATRAELLGTPLRVAALAGDQQAAAFAQGVHAEGAAKLTLGSSAMLDVHTGVSPANALPGAYPLALWTLADGSRAFCLEGTVVTAGSAVEWGVALGLARDAVELSRRAESAASSRGVRFVPALAGLGTPFLDDGARGAFLGLSLGSGPAELARALLEGVAQRCCDVCESLPIADGPLRVDGGLAQSDFLLRALADLSGREVLRAAEVEATALGAAFLAGLALGTFASLRECLARTAVSARVGPSLSAGERAAARADWSETLLRIRSRPPA
jgi:glycerol kinase